MRGTWYARVYLVVWIIQLYSYKICTTTPYHSAWNVSKTLFCLSIHSITLADRNMEGNDTYQGCLPSCELHMHIRCSLSGVLAKLKVRRLRMQTTQSWDWLACNLDIWVQSQDLENWMRNAIPRLHKFSDSAEHFHSQTVRAPIGGAPYKYTRRRMGPFWVFPHLNMKERPSPVDSNLMSSKQITSVMIIIAGVSLSEQHTDLLFCHCTKQDLSHTSRYLGIT